MNVEDAIADMPGAAALPRRNGELVFDAPWESRACGLAVGLSQAGVYIWDEFRERLIAEIATAAAGQPPAEWRYYEQWLAALESILGAKGIVSDEELDALVDEIAAMPEH